MIKVFISQGMQGLSDTDILNKRNEIINYVNLMENDEIEIIDSFFKYEEPADVKAPGLAHLGKSLELLATADVAYFARDYEGYRGCTIEHECALRYGIPVRFYD